MHIVESAAIADALQPFAGTQDNCPFSHCVSEYTGIRGTALHGWPFPLPPTGSNALSPAEVNFATAGPILVKLPDWSSPTDPHPTPPGGTSGGTK